jgi:hypothetical protein
MNGFSLVLLGVVLFVVGCFMENSRKIKRSNFSGDSGFKTIEDGITQNLLGQMEH